MTSASEAALESQRFRYNDLIGGRNCRTITVEADFNETAEVREEDVLISAKYHGTVASLSYF